MMTTESEQAHEGSTLVPAGVLPDQSYQDRLLVLRTFQAALALVLSHGT